MTDNERKSVYGDMTPAEIEAYDAGQDALWEANHTPPAETQGVNSGEAELMRLIKLGRKVDSIILHRRLYNSGLREACDAVDAMAENRPTYAQLEAANATLTRELEAAREESITKVLSEAVIDGYRFDISESFGGWIANYYWRNDGHRNGKNYGGIGETPQEAIQNAQNNLRKAAGEVGNE